ncbi:MAG: transglutaminase family protein [Chitinophagaceae bacterium]
MKLNLSAELTYTTFEPCVIVLNIHASRGPQVIIEENFIVTGDQHFTEIPSFPDNNRLIRINTNSPGQIHCSYTATVDNHFTIIDCEGAAPVNVGTLPPEILNYLNPSRYCQSDKLYRLANHQFGKIENDFEKVLAITEWIYQNVEYLNGSTNAETSAYDTVTQQAGVCRDFAHLGTALCRAITIPARYCAVYAYQLIPQDFHACFEAYIAGRWVIFDATKLAPLNGMARIAVGRDAADTAIASLFGNVTGDYLMVGAQSADNNFVPHFYSEGSYKGISYE